MAAALVAGIVGTVGPAAAAATRGGRVVQTGDSLPHHFVSSTWVPVRGLPAGAPSSIDEENQWAMAVYDGHVYAWGNDQMGELGDRGGRGDALDAVRVEGLEHVRSVDGSRDFGLAVTARGSVYAWGSDEAGDLGGGSKRVQDPTPGLVDFPTGTVISEVSAGNNHALALDDTGHLWAWGDNLDGDLGLGDAVEERRPVLVPSLSHIVAVSAGCDWSMALDASGRVWTWGLNGTGELGDGSKASSSTPVELPALPAAGGLPPIQEISAGGDYAVNGEAVALDRSGHVWAWGDNRAGQLGIGSPVVSARTPVEVPGLSSIASVSAGGLAALALSTTGQLYVWGDQANGQLGDVDGDVKDVRSPVASLTGVTQAWAGATGSLAVR